VLLLSPNGFVGSGVKRVLDSSHSLVTLCRDDLDFRDTENLTSQIRDIAPYTVINAAGVVAGIQGNIDNPVNLLMSNTEISTSVLRSCHEVNVPRYIQYVSACVYPLNESNLSRPEDLGTGPIEPTSMSYATAKILAIEAVRAYRKQHKRDWFSVIPTNLYGPGDWNQSSGGHVIAMLMQKFVFAKNNGSDKVTVWGDGKSRRSFLHIDDLAKATDFILRQPPGCEPLINVSGDQEITIKDLSLLIREVTEFDGDIIFDSTKPNGARRKQLDDSYLRGKGWRKSVTLELGLRDYLKHFLKRS